MAAVRQRGMYPPIQTTAEILKHAQRKSRKDENIAADLIGLVRTSSVNRG